MRTITVPASMHNIESRGAKRLYVPEGDYLLEIQQLRPCSAKPYFDDDSDRNPFYILTAQIVDGLPDRVDEQVPVGRVYTEFLTWSENGAFGLGRFLAAFGIGLPKEGDEFTYERFKQLGEVVTNFVKGKRAAATIGDNEYDGKMQSQIVEWFSAEEFAQRKAQRPVAVSSGMAPSMLGSAPVARATPAAAPAPAATPALDLPTSPAGNGAPAAETPAPPPPTGGPAPSNFALELESLLPKQPTT